MGWSNPMGGDYVPDNTVAKNKEKKNNLFAIAIL
jgi:hypothetical protein